MKKANYPYPISGYTFTRMEGTMNRKKGPRLRACFSEALLSIRFLSPALLLLISIGAYLPNAGAATGNITILHTNDIHSHLLGFGPNGEYTPSVTGDDTTVGGIARIAAKVNQIRSDRDNPVLLLDGGDFMMGSAFALLGGAAELSLMDHLHYNVITIGNHEFDWTPAGTALIYSHIPDLELNLPVVASNLIFDDAHSGDDALEALWDAGTLQAYHTETLENGLRVGYFGLLGKEAVSVAPFAYPVRFQDQTTATRAMVSTLQAEGVDVIICLSHSGIEEDSALAASVPGIDVIVSGHTHEKTESPVLVGNTIIVQAGAYTKYLGVLDLSLDSGVAAVADYALIPIDDTILGDPSTQELVETFKTQVDTSVLAPLGYSFSEVLAETAFDLTCPAGEEGNLGNLVTDAMRWMVDRVEYDPLDANSRKVDFAFESNGVIRDDILKGASDDKNIAFSDAFRALPLGFGLDGAVGYPMVTVYVTAGELKKALEVLTTLYPLMGSDFWLNVSGLRFNYLPRGIPFYRVGRIFVGDRENGYADTPLDASRSNTQLYKVAINYYVAQFIAVVGDYTYGILSIDPKDKNGVSYSDPTAHPHGLAEARVDTDPLTEGVQELQQWVGFMDYLKSLPDTDFDLVPNIPETYAGPEGRIVARPRCLCRTKGGREALPQ